MDRSLLVSVAPLSTLSAEFTYSHRWCCYGQSSHAQYLLKCLVQIYLSEVLEWHMDVISQNKWDEKMYTPTRKKLLSTLESISGHIPEALLKRLPADALYEERAILLGKMNQHEFALSLYVHKVDLKYVSVFSNWYS